MIRTLLTIIGCLCALSAHARLGWTLEQCRQNYGPEKSTLSTAGDPDLPTYLFEAQYFKIIVSMLDDKVEYIKYEAKPDPDAWINTEEFKFYTQPVINDILEKNLGKQKLIRSREDDFQGSLCYHATDGAEIFIDPPKGKYEENDPPTISINTAKMMKRIKDREEQKAEADKKKAAEKPHDITKGL
jgi:hypothetical protein